MFLLSWILFGALFSIMSRHKGYSAAIGVIAGVVGGIFGLVFILVLPDRIQEQEDFIQQDQELSSLRQRVAALERIQQSSEEPVSLVKPVPPMPAAPPDTPAVFPARTEEVIACPRCGRRQKGNRNGCYACGLPFQYENG